MPYYKESASDFMFEVAAGKHPGLSSVNKFGRNGDIDTGTIPEDVWTQGGTWVAPTQARTHDLVSTSANDAAAGTGMRTVEIQGLDANWDLQSETVTLNGTTNVATANTYTRIFRMYGATWGTGLENAGVITATAQTDATVTAAINTGDNQTLMAIYTVPRNHTAYIAQVGASINKSGGVGGLADMVLYKASVDDDARLVQHVFDAAIDGNSISQIVYRPYKKITEKNDIILTVEDVSVNNTDISGWFDLILEEA